MYGDMGLLPHARDQGAHIRGVESHVQVQATDEGVQETRYERH